MPTDQEATPTPSLGQDVPQFATAEFSHIPGSERCRICGGAIAGEYFRVNGQMACGRCAGEALHGQPKDSHAAFARALLFGIGAALAGLILYATIRVSLHFTMGYFALGVGWLVGTGIRKGSNGMGGFRYQIAAVLLTYLAISASAVPVLIVAINKAVDERNQQLAQSRVVDPETDAAPPQVRMHWDRVAGRLGLWAVASPFLELEDPAHGLLGLIILFVGLSIAFRMTAAKPLAVDGPYPVSG